MHLSSERTEASSRHWKQIFAANVEGRRDVADLYIANRTQRVEPHCGKFDIGHIGVACRIGFLQPSESLISSPKPDTQPGNVEVMWVVQLPLLPFQAFLPKSPDTRCGNDSWTTRHGELRGPQARGQHAGHSDQDQRTRCVLAYLVTYRGDTKGPPELPLSQNPGARDIDSGRAMHLFPISPARD